MAVGPLILVMAASVRAEEASGPLIKLTGPEASVSVHIVPAAATLLRRASLATLEGGGPRAAGYQEVCTSSCTISLPAGTYNLSLTLDGKQMPGSVPVPIPAGASNLEATFESRSATRAAGWALMVASPVVAYAILMGFKTAHGGQAARGGEVVLGLGVGVGTLVTGAVLATRRDRATFVISPVGVAEAGRPLGAVAAAARAF
jgi:hypothetical protein